MATEDEKQEGLDIQFASEILHAKIEQIEAIIEENQKIDLEEMPEVRDKNKWCIQVLYKFREAMVRLYGMFGEYNKAVKLALRTNMIQQACLFANRVQRQDKRKNLWLGIAKELLQVKQGEYED